MQVNRCLSIKGAEDILNKPHAFEVSTTDDSMFFIADTDKVRVYSPSPRQTLPALRPLHLQICFHSASCATYAVGGSACEGMIRNVSHAHTSAGLQPSGVSESMFSYAGCVKA